MRVITIATIVGLLSAATVGAFETGSVDGKIVARTDGSVTVFDEKNHYTIDITPETFVAQQSAMTSADTVRTGQKVQIVYNHNGDRFVALVLNITEKPLLVGGISPR